MVLILATAVLIFTLTLHIVASQPNPGGAIAAGGYPPPPPPPGRGFQLRCSDAYALDDQTDPAIVNEFAQNAPPGYDVVSVEPTIHPGKNAHRFLVKYRSHRYRRCEEIRRVFQNMTTYKPQNCNVGTIAVVPGGYLVEYKQYCQCYRRSYRRRRRYASPIDTFHLLTISPRIGPDGSVVRCDDRDATCGYQAF